MTIEIPVWLLWTLGIIGAGVIIPILVFIGIIGIIALIFLWDILKNGLWQ